MGDTFIISGLREKRASVAGKIIDLRREADQLESDLYHIDSVLRLYDVEPSEIPTKGRVSVRSSFFGRNEITRRVQEALRSGRSISAGEIVDAAMRDKRLDPKVDTKLRSDFVRRFLVSLHDLKKKNAVEKIGDGQNVRWRLAA